MLSIKNGLFATMLALAACASTKADLVINLGTTFNGTSPAGTAPFVVASFHDVTVAGINNDYVEVTLTVPGLVGTEYVSDIGFNFNPGKTLANLTKSNVSGATGTFSAAVDAKLIQTVHDLDILMSYPSSNAGGGVARLGAAAGNQHTSVFDFKLTGGDLFSTDFDFLTPAAKYQAVAHVQSIGTGGAFSGDIRNSPPSVPLPASSWMGLSLLAAMGGVYAARRMRAQPQ